MLVGLRIGADDRIHFSIADDRAERFGSYIGRHEHQTAGMAIEIDEAKRSLDLCRDRDQDRFACKIAAHRPKRMPPVNLAQRNLEVAVAQYT